MHNKKEVRQMHVLVTEAIGYPPLTESTRVCLVPHGMQNANYFGMMKCKISKFSWVCLVPSKMSNFSWGG
jgi:hypothetical protein